MKKITLSIAAISLLLASCNKKDVLIVTPTHQTSNANTITDSIQTSVGAQAYKPIRDWLFEGFMWLYWRIKPVRTTATVGYAAGPPSFGCQGSDGLCEFVISGIQGTSDSGSGNLQEGYVDAAIGVLETNHLMMLINKNTMDPRTYAAHYADGILSITHPWTLQQEFTNGLNLPSDYTIPKGDYKIDEDSTGILYIAF